PNGTVVINADGTLEYTPDMDFNGEDTITYTIEDPDGLSDTAEVTVTVTPVDDAPVTAPDTADVDEDDTVTIDVLGNDTDPNGDPLTVTEATAPNGTVTINPDGTLDYTPNPDFNGEDTITYTVEDPDGNPATGTVAVTVAPVNDAPVAEDDSDSTPEDTAVTIDVLGNDSDVDGDPLTVTAATAPNGTVVINADGTLEYTPDMDFNGEDTITYTIEDPDGLSDTAEVTVTVTPDDGGGDAGPVDGLDTGEVMNPGYTDADGDQIDGDDGLNDEIFGNGGNDVINAGEGNDTIDGGAGNDNINAGDGDDVIIRSDGGFEQMDGGAGDDTLTGNGEGDIRVHVDNQGNGDVFHGDTGSFGLFQNIENFDADEIDGLNDKIVFTEAVDASRVNEEINGLSDDAFGNFYPDGDTTNAINFGPDANYLLSDILGGTAPASGEEAVGPVGEFIIFGGDEDGEIGDISYEDFEFVQFNVEADEDYLALMRSPEEEARIADGAPLIEDEEDEDDLVII
ncbi:tandem-95 repeat protein, partial [Sulfitobacter sp. F26204]|uniref:Ig-like domain-containing protein n=2 Tax=Sulfitobacter sp. F26204 TaxID=2996014 RepID=UPI00225E68D8